MPRLRDDNREKLLKRKAQIEARLQLIDARQQKQKRIDDTRAKILYGSNAMLLAKDNPEFAKAMNQQLDQGLTRAIDRKLFGLPPLEPSKEKPD